MAQGSTFSRSCLIRNPAHPYICRMHYLKETLNSNRVFWAGLLAFVLATSCCWLPALLVGLGGVGLITLSNALNAISGPLMLLGGACFLLGGYQLYKRYRKMDTTINLVSVITCPECSHSKEEQMPTDACQFFYECENCKTILRPNHGDCCVYCSYGTVQCPPMQTGDKSCCT